MKKTLLFSLLSILPIIQCWAQLDEFSTPRLAVLSAPQVLTGTLTTNGPVDTHGYIGTGVVMLHSYINPITTGYTPEAIIGITNLPTIGQTFTVYCDGTNQIFYWTNTAHAATAITIGANTGVSGTNLFTALSTFYSATQIAPTVVGLTATTNDVLSVFNSAGWGTNQNYTIPVTTAPSNSIGTLTATLYTSSDTVNLTSLSSYAIGVPSSVSYTLATNNYLLPGTLTTPNASLSGLATPYLAHAPFTNSGSITMNGSTDTEIAFVIPPTQGYLFVVWNVTGSFINNSIVSSTFSGVRSGEVK
jgi:hypothetical protein